MKSLFKEIEVILSFGISVKKIKEILATISGKGKILENWEPPKKIGSEISDPGVKHLDYQ